MHDISASEIALAFKALGRIASWPCVPVHADTGWLAPQPNPLLGFAWHAPEARFAFGETLCFVIRDVKALSATCKGTNRPLQILPLNRCGQLGDLK